MPDFQTLWHTPIQTSACIIYVHTKELNVTKELNHLCSLSHSPPQEPLR